MGRFLIVSQAENRDECARIAKQYHVGYEYNDFFYPDVLDNPDRISEIIADYQESEIPEYCTMHGAFFDVTVFSTDAKIAEISRLRMRQSMEIAQKIGAKGVVFHTNINPFLTAKEYMDNAVNLTCEYMEELLQDFPNIHIYLENMFDCDPKALEKMARRLERWDNFGVCFDYAHAVISGTPIKQWIEALHPYIAHVHINDNDLKQDLHLAVGSGKIDWQVFKSYYDKYMQPYTVLVETSRIEDAEASLKYLNRLGIGF